MVPKKYQQSVRIHITTYKTDLSQLENSMDVSRKDLRRNANKFICSICLSTKGGRNDDFSRRMSKLCPICQRSGIVYNYDNKDTKKHGEIKLLANANKGKPNVEGHNNKLFINTEKDVSQGLNLLNEVLTVFKSKKQNLQKETSSKTAVFKDVSTSTDNVSSFNARTSLMFSKVFLCSIERNKIDENFKFTVVNSCQPDYFKNERVIGLKKHKSSSIPQMKMDELKYSLKEKTKSKDVVEEVNRMFATVNINSISRKSDDTNRPVTRNGPRILPVVKTKTIQDVSLKQSCKCCQTSDYCLSSGDSFVNPNLNQKRCEKCVYMLCCHYQKNHRRLEPGHVVCQNCHNVMEKRCNCDKVFENGYCENVG